MSFDHIALIGLGEVGTILADDLRSAGVGKITAFDVLFAEPTSAPSRAADDRAIARAASAPEAVSGAQLVISAVTAASDAAAAAAAAPGLSGGAFFLDLNSASPGEKQASFAIIEAAGGRYVEAAVMTPVPPKRIASQMLLGGPHAGDFLAAAQGLGLAATVFSPVVGKASATKMCRSVVIKGVEALLTESLLAARYYGVDQTVLESLSDLLPLPDWKGTALYMLSRSLEHGERRAEEMREAARTVAEAGIEPLMSRSIAQRQDWAAARKDALAQGELGPMLDAVRQGLPPIPETPPSWRR